LGKKNMRVAAVMTAILYCYLIVWFYIVFILDVADLGFTGSETVVSSIHGSKVYHSFVDMTERMSVIPLQLLKTIVGVIALILLLSISVVIHGTIAITKDVFYCSSKNIEAFKNKKPNKVEIPPKPEFKLSILKLYCRADC